MDMDWPMLRSVRSTTDCDDELTMYILAVAVYFGVMANLVKSPAMRAPIMKPAATHRANLLKYDKSSRRSISTSP